MKIKQESVLLINDRNHKMKHKTCMNKCNLPYNSEYNEENVKCFLVFCQTPERVKQKVYLNTY